MSTNRSARRRATLVVLVAVLAIVAYYASLAGIGIRRGLVGNDLYIGLPFDSVGDAVAAGIAFPYMRPIPYLLYHLAAKTGDINLWVHVVSGVLGAITCLISAAAVLAIVSTGDIRATSKRDWLFVATLSLVLLLHYSTLFNVTWVSGMQTLLGGFFFALGMLATVMYQRGAGARWLVMLAAASFLGFFSYEGALGLFVAPVLFWYLHGSLRGPRGRSVIEAVAVPMAVTVAARILLVGQAEADVGAARKAVVRLFEFPIALVNGADRPWFSYLYDAVGRASISDWAAPLTFTVGLGAALCGLVVAGLLRNAQPDRYRLWATALALIVLASLPMLVFRENFTPRLAFVPLLGLMLTLALGYRGGDRSRSLFAWASVLLLVASVYSFFRAADTMRLSIDARASLVSFASSVHPVGSRTLGVTLSDYYGFAVLSVPDDEIARYGRGETTWTGLGLFILKPMPDVGAIRDAVSCVKVGPQRYRYRVLGDWAHIRLVGARPWSMGDRIAGLDGSEAEVLSVSRRGNPTAVELSMPEGTTPIDCEWWAGKEG